MKEIFEKLSERLHDSSFWTASTFDDDGYSNDDSEEVIDLYKALEIVEQVADEVQQDQAYQFVLLHANILKRMGIDISSKWEDAKQQSEALEQAYLRGRQDEKEASNNGWILCSEKLPNEEGYYLITVLFYHLHNPIVMGCNFENGEWWKIDKEDKVIAWQPLPAPYQQK